ncbi:branched-chain amino acid ABC transporter permease [Nocardioides sp. SYSU DS0663]|uniref:branched-chain amino acid ABC transporter permease n=1 Tax=Nocardioides sp. SYSU DS0663 TaxID=3416445 RepID=UPI003F4B4828
MSVVDGGRRTTEDDTRVLPVTPAEEEPVAEFPAVLDSDREHRPGALGWTARGVVWAVLAWVVLAYPINLLSPFEVGVTDVDTASLAVIYAIGGLSLNVLLGYCGQISLGHQAFVGIGAFASAYVVTDLQLGFWMAVAVAAALGGLQAVLLGAVSLRLTGLYFALVTLAYGSFAQETLFGLTSITGGEGGKPAPRPDLFSSGYRYYYLCLAFLVVVLWIDWRLTRSKAGRAMAALRENPRVASSYGIDVRAYILVAFAVSGIFAGVAGSLTAHHDEVIVGSSFDFRLALLFVLMTVVGGLRDRVGVVIGSVFFALLEEGALVSMFGLEGFFEGVLGLPTEFVSLVVGPVLLVLTLTLYPGGIGQQVAPVRRWLSGHRFDVHAGSVREVEVSDVRA